MTKELTYAAANTKTQIRDRVRLLIHDIHFDRPYLDDAEIDAMILSHGRDATAEDPDDYLGACDAIAAECCDLIVAQLAAQSDSVLTDVGIVRSNASNKYVELAKRLRSKAKTVATPSFNNPSSYGTTHVVGVDTLPDLE